MKRIEKKCDLEESSSNNPNTKSCLGTFLCTFSSNVMGGQLSLLAQTSPSIAIFSYIDALKDVHYETQLNSSRFLKTCKALSPQGHILIKVFIKPNDSYLLQNIHRTILSESSLLSSLPNVLQYTNVVETTRAGYLIRQHLQTNLYDRIGSRPYFSPGELKFMIFQLLQIMVDIHNLDVIHGDIKTENILVTTSNWLILTDFSHSIKPAYLPEDNPGEFSFYFDTSKRRSCYVAPERFNSQLYSQEESKLTKEMDIFSMGCCIYELVTEGRPLFNLSQLFKYKNNDYSAPLKQLDCPVLQNLIQDMIQVNPEERLSASQLLEKYKDSFFPSCYYDFTYDYFKSLQKFSVSAGSLQDQVGIPDQLCDKIYNDFPHMCYSVGSVPKTNTIEELPYDLLYTNSITIGSTVHLPLQHTCVEEESAILFVSLLSHTLRNITKQVTKMHCLELLTAFSSFISDESKLDRVLPYLVASFTDASPTLQALSLQCVCQLLSTVGNLDPANQNIFADYLLPHIRKLLQSSKDYVRITIANCLGNLVEIESRFQELAFVNHTKNWSINDTQGGINDLEISKSYFRKLAEQIEELTIFLLTDNNNDVKIAIVSNILPLCKFFGKEKTNDIILSHLITYLNNKDSELRMKLVEAITGIAVLLGPTTLEQYILPLLIQTISDAEELVVVTVLKSLKDLCYISLISKKFFYDICSTISPLLLHPNNWIRQFTLSFIKEVSEKLSKAEAYCILYPILRPYFEWATEFNFELLIFTCKQPISRAAHNLLCSWFFHSSNTLFWKQAPNKHLDAFGNNKILFVSRDYTIKNYGLANLSKTPNAFITVNDEGDEIPLTVEDKTWIDKFKSIGISANELWKLAALRPYIVRAVRKSFNDHYQLARRRSNKTSEYEKIINQQFTPLPKILPTTVFFDVSLKKESLNTLSKDNMSTMTTVRNVKSSQNIPIVRDMNGSLILHARPQPTATPNLENVYVRLETDADDSDYEADDRTPKQYKTIVKNTYEGDIDTIHNFLNNIDVVRTIRDCKEFGYPSSTPHNEPTFSAMKGSNIMTLNASESKSICGVDVLHVHDPLLLCAYTDGTIKVWNLGDILPGKTLTSIIERNIMMPITGFSILPDSESFAISTKDGGIMVFRVKFKDKLFSQRKGPNTLKLIRQCNIGTNEKRQYAVQIKPLFTEEKSLLFVATNLSKVVVLDLVTMMPVQTIDNLQSYGAILSLAISRDGSTLALGTIKGVISVWDLRFNMLVKSWAFGERLPITHLEVCEHLGKKTLVVCGGTSKSLVSIWDYSRPHCRFTALTDESKTGLDHFDPIVKGLEDTDTSMTTLVQQNISALYVQGSIIMVSDNDTNNIVALSWANIEQSKWIGTQDVFKLLPVTASFSVALRYSPKGHERSRFHHDTVTSITSVVCTDKDLIVSADSSGVINFFA